MPVDHRAAGVAGAHGGPERRDLAPHRTLPVGVLGEHRARRGQPRGANVVGPVEREAEDRRLAPGPPPSASGSARTPCRLATRRIATSFFGSKKTGRGVEPGAVPAQLDGRVVLPGDHVRVGHHEPVAGHPARALEAQAAGGAEHPDDRCRRPRPPRGSRAIADRGAATSASGPLSVGNGSMRASALSSGPDGGSAAFSRDRISERWMSSRRPARGGRLQRDGARDPGDRERQRRRQRRAERARRRSAPPGRPGSSGAAPVAKPSKESDRITPPRNAPSSPKTGAYGEEDPSGSSSGATRVPEVGAADEARQREGADHEALAEARGGQQGREGDDDEVDGGHGGRLDATARHACGLAAEAAAPEG